MPDSSDAVSILPPPPPPPPGGRAAAEKFRAGALGGLRLLWTLIKIIVPVSLGVEALRLSGFLEALGRWLAPVMALWGLPGESVLVVLSGTAVNLYAAVAVIETMSLSWQQVSVLGLGLGLAHSLPPEMTVLRQAGAPWLRLLWIRLAAAAGASLALHWAFVLWENLA
jgi:hypothetical protein